MRVALVALLPTAWGQETCESGLSCAVMTFGSCRNNSEAFCGSNCTFSSAGAVAVADECRRDQCLAGLPRQSGTTYYGVGCPGTYDISARLPPTLAALDVFGPGCVARLRSTHTAWREARSKEFTAGFHGVWQMPWDGAAAAADDHIGHTTASVTVICRNTTLCGCLAHERWRPPIYWTFVAMAGAALLLAVGFRFASQAVARHDKGHGDGYLHEHQTSKPRPLVEEQEEE